MELLTKSAAETQEIGRKVGAQLKGGEILALRGELGAGKTTFTQGLAGALGIERVNSPSFIIVRTYNVEHSAQNIENFYHIDLYRLEENIKEELNNLGITDIWGKPENIVLIEWADKAQELLPKKTIFVDFEYEDEDRRRIKITNFKI